MKFFREKDISLFWVIYAFCVVVFTVYVLYGFPYSGEALLSWLVWSDLYRDVWKCILVMSIPLLAAAPLFALIGVVVEKIFSIIFFVLFVKVTLVLSPAVRAMDTVSRYEHLDYSILSLLLVSVIILFLSSDKKGALLSLFYLSFIAVVVNLQLVVFLSFQ